MKLLRTELKYRELQRKVRAFSIENKPIYWTFNSIDACPFLCLLMLCLFLFSTCSSFFFRNFQSFKFFLFSYWCLNSISLLLLSLMWLLLLLRLLFRIDLLMMLLLLCFRCRCCCCCHIWLFICNTKYCFRLKISFKWPRKW